MQINDRVEAAAGDAGGAEAGLVVEEWDETVAGRTVHFVRLREMFSRRDGGPAEPIGFHIDYDGGVVQLWAGLSPRAVASVTARAAGGFWRRRGLSVCAILTGEAAQKGGLSG